MSNTASKCVTRPSRCKTASAWSVEPLVRISLRPGSFAIAAPIARLGSRRGNFQPGADELADPRIDLLPQIDVMRVQRVVEVEHPGVDMGEGAGGLFHCVIGLSSR